MFQFKIEAYLGAKNDKRKYNPNIKIMDARYKRVGEANLN